MTGRHRGPPMPDYPTYTGPFIVVACLTGLTMAAGVVAIIGASVAPRIHPTPAVRPTVTTVQTLSAAVPVAPFTPTHPYPTSAARPSAGHSAGRRTPWRPPAVGSSPSQNNGHGESFVRCPEPAAYVAYYHSLLPSHLLPSHYDYTIYLCVRHAHLARHHDTLIRIHSADHHADDDNSADHIVIGR